MIDVEVSGFDWDAGNLEKCQKHGVSQSEIEALFAGSLRVRPDVEHSQLEERLQAIGKGKGNRFVFLVFTIRMREGNRYIRSIRALHAPQGNRTL